MSYSLRINRLDLRDIARFHRLSIVFNQRVTVVCGANGVGKTSVLDTIAASVVGYNLNAYLRRRADSDSGGEVSVGLLLDGHEQQVSGRVNSFYPEEKFDGFGEQKAAPHLIYLRATRDFSYVRKDSIKRDIELQEYQYQVRAFGGVDANEIKDWFANRYLMRPHGGDWPEYRRKNLEVAVSLFGLLDQDVSLHGVDTSTFDINVATSAGIIPYEYLSSGFRSAFSMMLGIIKEIEYRKLNVSAAEFGGVILIDEVDLHLHPTWQSKILQAISKTFGAAQIIVSTHSPHVVQSVKSDEVMALLVNPDGGITVESFSPSQFGFVGWSIEEILSDVMGVTDVTSAIYRRTVENFNSAIRTEDIRLVTETYDTLNKMLHPSSPLRDVFFLQASQFLEPKKWHGRADGSSRD